MLAFDYAAAQSAIRSGANGLAVLDGFEQILFTLATPLRRGVK